MEWAPDDGAGRRSIASLRGRVQRCATPPGSSTGSGRRRSDESPHVVVASPWEDSRTLWCRPVHRRVSL